MGEGKGDGFGIRYERVRWEIVPFSIDEPREYGRRLHGKGERQEGLPTSDVDSVSVALKLITSRMKTFSYSVKSITSWY